MANEKKKVTNSKNKNTKTNNKTVGANKKQPTKKVAPKKTTATKKTTTTKKVAPATKTSTTKAAPKKKTTTNTKKKTNVVTTKKAAKKVVNTTKGKTTTKKTAPKKNVNKTVPKKVENKVVEPVKKEEVKKVVEPVKKEESKKSETKKEKKIVVSTNVIYTIIGLTVLAIVIILTIVIKPSNSDYKKESNTGTTTSSPADENIPEDERKELNSINIDQFLEMLKGEEAKIIYIGRPTCGHCVKQKPIMENIVFEYGVEINYLNTDELDDDDVSKLISSNEYFSEGFGTPLTLIVKDNQIVDKAVGETSKADMVNMFKEQSLIK